MIAVQVQIVLTNKAAVDALVRVGDAIEELFEDMPWRQNELEGIRADFKTAFEGLRVTQER